ncbi:hypothetical protein L228DRAFT_283934 [Xylona heveae TC161]|uniref:Tetrapyrrole biosynthesis uroporphyrinogen III synthase domain-containing protein n=1 Tax=Xylona heveae (strain CBS 132557 / TC161) TaxID=1328760 RepID=A0A165G6T5_XYLHT|nr:hypothetical protein L228DRAFT_283934 [Xylona heveae TC161]KZF21805.1 hypothetical protein L228DRAFT_283934 [Xylona heveae TC161]
MSSKTSNPLPIPVLLLKTKSTPNDGYDELFSRDPPGVFTPRFVPVLEHRFHAEHMKLVKKLLSPSPSSSSSPTNSSSFPTKSSFEGPNPRYGGMIFTSQRAVEAFAQVVDDVRSENSLPPDAPLLSPKIPLYTVGPATARALTSINVCSASDESRPSNPRDSAETNTEQETYGPNIHGYESGNGAALADYILPHYNNLYRHCAPSSVPPLLFLVGEQRRAIIPDTLKSGIPNSPGAKCAAKSADGTDRTDRTGGTDAGSSKLDENAGINESSTQQAYKPIQVDELVVYETGVMEPFEQDFRAVLDATSSSSSSSSCPSSTSPPSSWKPSSTNDNANTSISSTSPTQSSTQQAQAEPATRWVVVFSPTGCDTMLRCLGWLDPATGKANSELQTPEQRRHLSSFSSPLSSSASAALSTRTSAKEGTRARSVQTYIATIGPTTRDYLRDTFGFDPDVSAAKPSPEGLMAGIEGYMRCP